MVETVGVKCMGRLLNLSRTALLLSVLTVPSMAVAQETNPYQQPNQYQPPFNQVTPPQPERPSVSQPEPQAQPSEPVAAPPEPTLYQETAAPAEPVPQAQPQEPTPEVPLAAPTADIASPNQQNASSSGYYILYAVIITGALFWFGWGKKFYKGKKKPDLPAEDDGTVCKTCGGKGTITKKRTITVPCYHCKQTGRDICHHCGGSGRYGVGLTVPQTQEEVESLMKCDYCGGKGFPKTPFACCMCKGKRKEEFEESYETPCPDCRGTGRTTK